MQTIGIHPTKKDRKITSTSRIEKSFDKQIDKMTQKKILLSQYNVPIKSDVLIIIPFYNPANSIRMVQNLLMVLNKLKNARIPYHLIECIFPNSVQVINDTENHTVVHSDSYAFVKENLTDICISKFKDQYKKFLLLDADMIYTSPDWYDKVSKKLDAYEFIHGYETVRRIDANFYGYNPEQHTPFNLKNNKIACGFIFGFTLLWYNKGYFQPECLIGGGDSVTLYYIMKHNNTDNMYKKVMYRPTEIFKYMDEKLFIEPCTISYIEDEIAYHLYHSNEANRQYTSRHMTMKKYLKSMKDRPMLCDIIKKNDDGVYEWLDELKEEINEFMSMYFLNRNDDEIN